MQRQKEISANKRIFMTLNPRLSCKNPLNLGKMKAIQVLVSVILRHTRKKATVRFTKITTCGAHFLSIIINAKI